MRIPSAVSIDCYGASKIRSYGGRGSFFWFSGTSLSLSYPTKLPHPQHAPNRRQAPRRPDRNIYSRAMAQRPYRGAALLAQEAAPRQGRNRHPRGGGTPRGAEKRAQAPKRPVHAGPPAGDRPSGAPEAAANGASETGFAGREEGPPGESHGPARKYAPPQGPGEGRRAEGAHGQAGPRARVKARDEAPPGEGGRAR